MLFCVSEMRVCSAENGSCKSFYCNNKCVICGRVTLIRVECCLPRFTAVFPCRRTRSPTDVLVVAGAQEPRPCLRSLLALRATRHPWKRVWVGKLILTSSVQLAVPYPNTVEDFPLHTDHGPKISTCENRNQDFICHCQLLPLRHPARSFVNIL